MGDTARPQRHREESPVRTANPTLRCENIDHHARSRQDARPSQGRIHEVIPVTGLPACVRAPKQCGLGGRGRRRRCATAPYSASRAGPQQGPGPYPRGGVFRPCQRCDARCPRCSQCRRTSKNRSDSTGATPRGATSPSIDLRVSTNPNTASPTTLPTRPPIHPTDRPTSPSPRASHIPLQLGLPTRRPVAFPMPSTNAALAELASLEA